MQFPHTTRDVTKNNLWDLYPSLSIYKRSVSVLFVFFDRHFSFLYVAMSLVQLRVVELTADVLIRMLILMLLAMVILKITSALRRVLVISFVIACEALSELRSPGYASEISMDIVQRRISCYGVVFFYDQRLIHQIQINLVFFLSVCVRFDFNKFSFHLSI